jgi:hypothetical protein
MRKTSLEELLSLWKRNKATLGLGADNNPRHATFSNIGDEITYVELNDDNNWIPKYYITYEGD